MRLVKVRLRLAMIAIGVFALIFAAWVLLKDLHEALLVDYRPGGPVELRTQFYQELARGSAALRQGDFDEAEARYTTALRLAEKSSSTADQTSWYDVPAALIGLADSLAGRARLDEAEPLYTRALAIREDGYGPDDPSVAEILEHYAASLDRAGRAPDRDRITTRSRAIRAKAVRK